MATALRDKRPPYLIQRGQVWYYDFAHQGKRHKGSTGTTDRAEAERIALEIKQEVVRSAVAAKSFSAVGKRATELFGLYLDRRLKGKADSAKTLHRVFVQRFIEYFGNVQLDTIDVFKVEDWRDWLLQQQTKNKNWATNKILSPKTVVEHLVWLGSVYKYFKLTNPVTGIQKPKRTKDESLESIQFWDDKQLKALLEAADKLSFGLPMKVMLYTGCRPAELRYLRNTPTEIDKDNHVIKFVDKRVRARGIQLTGEPFDAAWQAIMDWIAINDIKPGEALFPAYPNWLIKGWHAILRKAGLPMCRTHQLRHQFVKTMFYTYGWPMDRIAKWCGHQTAMAFNVYSNLMVQAPHTPPASTPAAEAAAEPAKSKTKGATDVVIEVTRPWMPLDHVYRGIELRIMIAGTVDGVDTITITKDDFERLAQVYRAARPRPA